MFEKPRPGLWHELAMCTTLALFFIFWKSLSIFGAGLVSLLRDAGHQIGGGGLPGALGALGGFLGGMSPFGPAIGGQAGGAAGRALGSGLTPQNIGRGEGVLGSVDHIMNPTSNIADRISGEVANQIEHGSGSAGDRVAAGAGNLAEQGAYDAAKAAGDVLSTEASIIKGIVNVQEQAAEGAARGISRYVSEQSH